MTKQNDYDIIQQNRMIGEEIMHNSWFNAEEIKYNIDTAIQLSMYYSDKEVWDALLEAQSRLYEQFGIEER